MLTIQHHGTAHTLADLCQGHGGHCDCQYDEYSDCAHVAMEIDLGTTSYCDGSCASALQTLADLEERGGVVSGRNEEVISLEVHGCGATSGSSWTATFDGPDAERWALAYVSARSSTHAFSESRVNPVAARFAKLLDMLHPTCEHGLSLDLCAGPGTGHWSD
jgi:hypothetical protein